MENSQFCEEENSVPVCAFCGRDKMAGFTSSGLHLPWLAVGVTWAKAVGSDRVAVTSPWTQRQRKEK